MEKISKFELFVDRIVNPLPNRIRAVESVTSPTENNKTSRKELLYSSLKCFLRGGIIGATLGGLAGVILRSDFTPPEIVLTLNFNYITTGAVIGSYLDLAQNRMRTVALTIMKRDAPKDYQSSLDYLSRHESLYGK